MPGGRKKQDWGAKWGAISQQVIERLEDGETLSQICRSEGFPNRRTVLDWLDADAELARKYARARQRGHDAQADRIVHIAHTVDLSDPKTATAAVNAARLQVDTWKWLLSRLEPAKYGDRTALEHSGPGGKPLTVLVRSVLDEPFPEEKKTGE